MTERCEFCRDMYDDTSPCGCAGEAAAFERDHALADVDRLTRERDEARAEVERLREDLEEIIGEPWLMGGRGACEIAAATLYPPAPTGA